MNNKTTVFAAAYARFSSDNQREESIEAQLYNIRDFASRSGIEIVREYTDEAKSARSDNRPGFISMIRDAEAGLFNMIIVHKLDRFSRDRYDFAYYRRVLRKAGVQLVSVLERLDESPESVMMESVIEGMAEYYSRNLAREVMIKGLLPNARVCKHNGGDPPTGYKVNSEGMYEIDETEAEHIRIIFEMYTHGDGYGKIIDELSRRGFVTRNGRPYSKTTIYGILRNEKYTGVYIYNRAPSKSPDGKRNNWKSKPNDEIIRIDGGIPAIISREIWEKAAERMTMNKHKGARNKSKRQYLLSGKLFCGKCGSAFVGNTNDTRGFIYSYYECAAKKRNHTCDISPIRADYIEDEVVKQLYTELFSPEVVDKAAEEILQYLQTRGSELPARISELRKQITKTDTEIDNIVNAIASGINSVSLRERLLSLEQVKTDLQARLSDATLKSKEVSFTRERIIGFLQSFQGIIDAPFEHKRRAVETFIDKVYVYDDNIDIDIIVPISGGAKRGKNFGFEQSRSVSTIQIQNIFLKRIVVDICNYRQKKRRR